MGKGKGKGKKEQTDWQKTRAKDRRRVNYWRDQIEAYLKGERKRIHIRKEPDQAMVYLFRSYGLDIRQFYFPWMSADAKAAYHADNVMEQRERWRRNYEGQALHTNGDYRPRGPQLSKVPFHALAEEDKLSTMERGIELMDIAKQRRCAYCKKFFEDQYDEVGLEVLHEAESERVVAKTPRGRDIEFRLHRECVPKFMGA